MKKININRKVSGSPEIKKNGMKRSFKITTLFTSLFIFALFLVACGNKTDEAAIQVAIRLTQTAAAPAVAEQEPTATPIPPPTRTPHPTFTPKPTKPADRFTPTPKDVVATQPSSRVTPPADATVPAGRPAGGQPTVATPVSDGGEGDDGQATTTEPVAPLSAATVPPSDGSDSTKIALTDMGDQTYFGYSGGLFPGGSNNMPATHHAAGMAFAKDIEPLDIEGNPDPEGKIILLSVGMSNTVREFCGSKKGCSADSFTGQAESDPAVNSSTLVIMNGARGGQDAPKWDQPNDYNYNWVDTEQLYGNGFSPLQVQVVWVKIANGEALGSPSMPETNADAIVLMERTADILRALRHRYPNLKQVYVSSRIYAGYATIAKNPEPYAYESGFAMKWLIEAQIHQMETGEIDPIAGDLGYPDAAPWVSWGPYMWADGLTPRSDGLTWPLVDFAHDGTHPGPNAIRKVGGMLLNFMKTSPHAACWFLEDGICQ